MKNFLSALAILILLWSALLWNEEVFATPISGMTDGGYVTNNDRVHSARPGTNPGTDYQIKFGSMAAQLSSAVAITGGTAYGLTGIAVGTATPRSGVVADFGANTSSILLPIGTTSQRPTGLNGMLRFNSTTNQYEGFYSSAWHGFLDTGVTTLSSLSTVGTITSGVWNGTTIAVANGGTGVTSAQGNGTKVQLSSGTTTTNDCVKFDANGNTVDAGSACGSGSGSGTVNSGTATHAAYYASSTTAVSDQPLETFSGDKVTIGTQSASTLYAPGKIGIGTTTPLVPLDVNGDAHFEKVTQAAQFNGDYNVSMCGNTFKPIWCSGADIGAWINSAVTAIGTSYLGTIHVDPSSGPYSFSTKATVPANIGVKCQRSELDFTATSGAAFVLSSAAANFTYDNLGGLFDCHLLAGTITNSGGDGYRVGDYSTGTAIGVYLGGDPNGVLSPLTNYGVGFILSNVEIEGFKTPITYGNNTWVDKFDHVNLRGNYDGYVDPVPSVEIAVDHFSITSNVVTLKLTGNTITSGVVYVEGLSTGTYLNDVPLTISTQNSTTITAAFVHSNVGNTADSGTLYQGTPQGTSGEQMTIVMGNIHDNQNCGMNFGGLGQWDIHGTSFDYNATTPSATVNNICGTSINMLDLYGVHFENTNGPMIAVSGNANVNVWGGSIFYNNDTPLAAEHGVFHALGSAGIGSNPNSNSWSVHDLQINGGYVPDYIVYTNGAAGINLDVQGGSNYVPNTSGPAITDAAHAYFPMSGFFVPQGGIGIGTTDAPTAGIYIGSATPSSTANDLYAIGTSLMWNGAAVAGGGGGTVSTFSCVTANGVSCSVANATTTPAATFTLAAITPTTVAATGAISSTQAISATSTDGLLLTNTTAATVGAQKWSPRIHLTGQGWKTTATAASQTVDVIEELQPVQGSANPTYNLVVSGQVNGAGYGVLFTVPSGGGFNLNSGTYQIGGTQITCSNLSNGATGCSTATGTSGATIPLLNGANTWSGTQTLSAVNLATDTTTGMKIGTSTSQKIAFYNSTPIVQPSGDALTALSNLGLVSSPTLATADLPSNQTIRSIAFVIDGGGSTITTGVKGDLQVPFACTINSATLLADQSGSIVVNVWKDTYANYPPDVSDKITASAPPTISSAAKATDSTLTGWTTSISAGDTLRFNVDSVTTIQRVTLILKCAAT